MVRHQVFRSMAIRGAALVAAALLTMTASTASAVTIVELNLGCCSSGADAVWGESLTTPAGGPWNQVAFTFLDLQDQPFATGPGFLLSQEYLGTPGDLSSLTPGFLGSASAGGGSWTFAPSLTVQPLTPYFFYATDTFPAGSLSGSNVVPGGQYYLSVDGGDFVPGGSNGAVDFRLTGTQVPEVPEPTSMVLLGTGLASARLLRRMSRKRRA